MELYGSDLISHISFLLRTGCLNVSTVTMLLDPSNGIGNCAREP